MTSYRSIGITVCQCRAIDVAGPGTKPPMCRHCLDERHRPAERGINTDRIDVTDRLNERVIG